MGTEFEAWLARHHPEVQLTHQQQGWADAIERGRFASMIHMAPKRSGKTFFRKLYAEFLTAEETHARPSNDD